MKFKTIFASLLAGVAIVACGPKAETVADAEGDAIAPVVEKTAKDYMPSKARIDSVSYLIGVNFGSFIKGYNFGDVNFSQIQKGMKDFINAKGNPRDAEFGEQFKINPEVMNTLFNEYLEQVNNYTAAVNKEKEAKFLEANKNRNGVIVSESGLQYRIIDQGNTDLVPGPTDTVVVNYEGKLIDGTVFDKSEEGSPVDFVLNRVIKGWTEGLQYIGEGGKIELFIPAELGYGERGTQGIEPYSTLIFTTELVRVGKAVAE